MCKPEYIFFCSSTTFFVAVVVHYCCGEFNNWKRTWCAIELQNTAGTNVYVIHKFANSFKRFLRVHRDKAGEQ